MLSLHIETAENGYVLRKTYAHPEDKTEVTTTVVEELYMHGDNGEPAELTTTASLLWHIVEQLGLPCGNKHDLFRLKIGIEKQK
jgi:hypothetical protein